MSKHIRFSWGGLFFLLVLCVPAWVGAVPGPDSVAVIANKNIKESVALAQTYAKARFIPAGQVCLLDLPSKDDITLADYKTKLLAAFEACLKKGGATARIEAVVLMKGVPLRVTIQGGSGSTAAVLSMWKSTIATTNKPVLGLPVGYRTTNNLLAAGWTNGFRTGVFRPGWSIVRPFRYTLSGKTTNGTYTQKPLLVTMLNGRSYADAGKLLQSALDAEKSGGAKGEFLFMLGRDRARGAMDGQFPGVMNQLKQRGFTTNQIKFTMDLTGRKLASFIVGTATLGKAIEGNTYLPGSIVDNLTSFGAVPRNFQATGQSQVSIARWVAKGVAGAHGTTAEPLNNCFPHRLFIVDYVDGSTLAEAYYRRMPYAYWRNLVLGDPMAAPYAIKPVVKISGATQGAAIQGARKITVSATDANKRGIASITLLVNGKVVATSKTASLTHCVNFDTPGTEVLAVAQAKFAAANNRRKYQPKGWKWLSVKGSPGGPTTCTDPEPKPEPRPEPTPEPRPEPVPEPAPDAPTQEPTSDASAADLTPPDPGTQPDTTPDTTTQPDATTQPDPGKTPDVATQPDLAPLSDKPTGGDTGAGTDTPSGGGCGCNATATPWSMLWGCLLLGLLGWRREK